MIKDNIIMFGYGTVVTTSKGLSLTFTHIKPPQVIGTDLIKMDGVEKIKSIIFDFGNDFLNLFKNLLKVKENNYEVEFRGYILDFSHYDSGSVQVVIKGVDRVINSALPMMAC